MESLESKLERLTPFQQKEVEDFVDFLLSRSGIIRDVPGPIPVAPPLINGAPPPLTMIEPVHIMTGSLHETEQQSLPGSGSPSPAPEETAGVIQEIGTGGDDWIARDYLDYGKFEQPSPAAEAVKKVKEKLGRRQEQDKGNHILEWID